MLMYPRLYGDRKLTKVSEYEYERSEIFVLNFIKLKSFAVEYIIYELFVCQHLKI